MSDEKIEIIKASGNVFYDFDHPTPDIELMKANLSAQIISVLNERHLSVRKAGEIAQVQYADISRVRNADLDKFTVDWLAKVFSRLKPEVEVSLTFSKRGLAEPLAAY